jgi:hypothetical protein
VAAARRGFERDNGVLGASLHEQCVTENMQRARVLGMGSKDFASDQFGFTRPFAVQCESGPLDELVGTSGTPKACASAEGPRIFGPVCHYP